MRRDYKSPAFALSRRKFGGQCRELEPYHALVRDHREVAWQTDNRSLTIARNRTPAIFPRWMKQGRCRVRCEMSARRISYLRSRAVKSTYQNDKASCRRRSERRLVAVRRRRRAPV